MDKYNFQNCQKIVVFSADNTKVLLAKRKGENDYDGIYSFIGGKMEITDKNLIEGMRREKNEEIGESFRVKLFPIYNTSTFYIKKDGSYMVLPHYYARYVGGDILLSDEYSEYLWVKVEEIDSFKPIIENIPEFTKRLLKLVPLMNESDFVLI